jgi:ribokinase
MKKCDVIFIGNTTYDVLGVLKREIGYIRNHELSHQDYSFGGKAANAAIYCAVSRASGAFVGTVGNDFDEIGYRSYMEKFGIDTSGVFSTGEKTPTYVAFSFRGKTYSFSEPMQFYQHSGKKFLGHVLKAIRLYRTKIVYCALSNQKTVINIFQNARERNQKTAWNLMPSTPDWTRIDYILEKTDFLFMNGNEANILQDHLSTSISNLCEVFGISAILITLGRKGCRFHTKEGEKLLPAYEVSQVTDTTGAGDAFAGSFLAALVSDKNRSVEECISYASHIASLVVQKLGSRVDSAMIRNIKSAKRDHGY